MKPPAPPSLVMHAMADDLLRLPSDNNAYVRRADGKGRALTSNAKDVKAYLLLQFRNTISTSPAAKAFREIPWNKLRGGRFELLVYIACPRGAVLNKEGFLKTWDVQSHQKLVIDAHTEALKALGFEHWDDNLYASVKLEKRVLESDKTFRVNVIVAWFADEPCINTAPET